MADYDKDNQDNDSIFQDILKEFSFCEDYWNERYDNGEDDLKFTFGINQWDEKQQSDRERQKRQCLTFNQCLPYANQVVNDYRQSRPSIRVTPVDSEGDEETAEIIQGLIRSTERQSRASVAYDTGFQNAVYAGLGWLRVGTQYVSDSSFDQEPFIDRVINFRSVYIDPRSMELDGSDAEYGFVFELMKKDEYEDKYPDNPVEDFDKATSNEWAYDDAVRIAEYFCKEYDTETLYLVEITQDGESVQRSVSKDQLELLEGFEYEVIDTREVEKCSVKRYLLSGGGILEEDDWVGQHIPLVPVYGLETYIDGKREFSSLIRQGKDAQRAFNYWKTASTEFIALQQKAPYIAPVGSFKTYSQEWENANNENYAYLEYDIVKGDDGRPQPPPMRQPPVQGSVAMMQEADRAREDIRMSLGMPQANMGERGNEISGIAIRNRQIEGDNAMFHFAANMAISMSQVGTILLDLYTKLYTGERVVRILGEDSREEYNIPLGKPYVKEGKEYREARNGENPDGIFKLDAGKYDVVMDVGASYSSKRQETADKLSELMTARPELVAVAGDILFDVLDLPRGDDIAKRLQAQMPPELLGEDPQAARLQEASQALQQMQEQVLNMEAALADKEKNAKFEQATQAEKLQLERDKFMVDAEKTKADIQKIYADIQNQSAETSLDAISTVLEEVQDLRGAVEVILQDVEDDVLEMGTDTPEVSATLTEENENE